MKKMKNIKASLISLIFFCSLGNSFGQVQDAVDAVTFQQLDTLQKKERMPVLVFIHTSWCKYCEAMEHSTFQNQKVKELLNNSFYFVELNAEEKQNITVMGHTFRYRPTGAGAGHHELAQELGMIDGKVSFPTICFLNSEYEIIYQVPGFLTAKQLIEILNTVKSKI